MPSRISKVPSWKRKQRRQEKPAALKKAKLANMDDVKAGDMESKAMEAARARALEMAAEAAEIAAEEANDIKMAAERRAKEEQRERDRFASCHNQTLKKRSKHRNHEVSLSLKRQFGGCQAHAIYSRSPLRRNCIDIDITCIGGFC